MSKKKAPRYRFQKYLQVPANFRQLILEKNLSRSEILTFLLTCEETVGRGRRAVRLSNSDIAAKNGINERSAVRSRTSLKEHGMLAVDVSENCWKTHESALVSPNFPMIQSGEEVPEEADSESRATVTDGGSPTDTDDRGATVTDDREIHQDQLQEVNQRRTTQADSPAAPRKTREANPVSPLECPLNPKTKARKADPPAKTAGEEKPSSVEEKKSKADPSPPWTGSEFGQIRKRLSAFMDGEDPPDKLMAWICTEFEGVCPARDVCVALEAAWNRGAAPGKKNAPRSWNWFYPTLRNALVPGASARLPEHPAAPHAAHKATAEELAGGIEAIELANAPRSIVESVPCAECGGSALARYTDNTIEGCGCRQKGGEGLKRISVSSAPGIRLSAGARRRSANE